MPLFDQHGREIQQPDIHDPQGVSAADAELLARMVEEIRALDAGEPMACSISPLTAVQLAGLIQLALRHEGTAGDIRRAAWAFLDGVRDYFADSPAVLEILRRGDDPACDTRLPGDALIAQARADVTGGSGHNCSEWWNADGICALCDRRKDVEAL